MKNTLLVARMMLVCGLFAAFFTSIAGFLLCFFWIALSPAIPVIGGVLGMICGFATGCIGSTLGSARGWGIAAYWSITAYFYLLLPMSYIPAILFVNAIGLAYAFVWAWMVKLLYSPEDFPDPYMPLALGARTALKASPSAVWDPKTRYGVAFVQAVVYGLVVYCIGTFDLLPQ